MKYYQLIFKAHFRDSEFFEGNTYIFKSDLELEKGDYVVALTKFGYQIAVVFEQNDVEVSNSIYNISTAKIVTKLEGNYYQEKEKAEKIREIEKILDRKAKDISKFMKYETIAKYDKEALELLKEYEDLKSNTIALPITNDENIEEYENIPF